jgi:hypothetical protein
MSLAINYFLAISISGVFVLSILALLCFFNLEIFGLGDKAEVRGFEMLVCVLVSQVDNYLDLFRLYCHMHHTQMP